MNTDYYSYLNLSVLWDTSTAFKLIRSRNLPLIMSFLHQEYKEKGQISVPFNILQNQLAEYLETLTYEQENPDNTTHDLHIDYEERAKIYLNKWIDATFLRSVIDDANKEPLVLLSKYTEKVFLIFELLREKEFVGTESRFKDIFSKLQDIIENANPDKEKRLRELEKRKKQIEEEIQKIKRDGMVETYEDYQIKSRFEEVNRLANELMGDFKEVEDNFKDITRQIYEKQQNAALSKGQLLKETFDAIYELRETEQGKSFYAFWQFMLDDDSQTHLQKLTREVYEVLEARKISIPNKSLRKLKSLLHIAARKVLDKNSILADKLSREIIARDKLESRKTRELISSIRAMALQAVGKPPAKEFFLYIDGNPDIYMPMERKPGEKPMQNNFTSEINMARLKMEELQDLSKLYKADLIVRQKLQQNIKNALRDRPQITLQQLTELYPINKGLAELLSYISLLEGHPKHFINDSAGETILFDEQNHRCIELPQIIFVR